MIGENQIPQENPRESYQEFIPFVSATYQSGNLIAQNPLLQNFTYPNRYPTSKESIGIEVVGKAIKDNEKITYQKYPSLQYESHTWDTPTQSQKDSIKNLIEILKKEYNLSNNDISPQKTRGEAKGLYENI